MENAVLRATEVIPKDDWTTMPVECVVLGFEQRHQNAIAFTTVSGKPVRLDLAEPVALRSGDALRLEGGELIEVIGQPEPLAEIRALTPDDLARIAWYLGSRHFQCEVSGGTIRIRRDPMLMAIAEALGGKLRLVEAAFDPIGAVYARARRQRSGHEDSNHVHDANCGCGHDHDLDAHGAHGHVPHDHGHHPHDHQAHQHKAHQHKA